MSVSIELPSTKKPPHPNRDLIDGLHQLAEWLESHPQDEHAGVVLNLFPPDKDTWLASIRGAGRLEKRVVADWYYLVKKFGLHVTAEWNQPRERVCKRVVVGTKVIPAQPEKVLPAEPERTEEIVEWQCPESILAAGDDDRR